MSVIETLKEGLKRGYKIVVPAADLEAKVDEKLAEAQPEVEMKGFRKGKVPMALLKKQFGERMMGEAMQESVDGAISALLEESGDRPAMQPEVKMTNEDWKPGDDVELDLSYEKLPEIPEVDFASIELERLVVKPSDEDVAEALENIAKNAQNFEAREEGAKAEDGDQVVFDFAGSVDGEAFDGGTSEGFPLVLGSGQFIPGFEEQLVGLKVGDEKDVTVTFPENYGAEHLAGKEAVFACKVHEVKAPAAAEINDDLAKQFGAEDLEALKTGITEQMSGEFAQAARAVVKRSLLDALDEKVAFDLPEGLLDAEAKQIAHQLWHEDHPEVQGHDHPEIEVEEDHKKLAARRVRLGLVLAEIGQKAEIEVTDGELTQAILNQARQYPGQEKAFFDFVQQNAQMRQQLQAPIFEDKVVDHILDGAKVSEKEVSKADLEAALEKLEEE
ncbi:MAG: trigger factor [Rhodobacterales bacterium]|nr:MAG: trigger factor [Rhodobacterales bacterium]